MIILTLIMMLAIALLIIFSLKLMGMIKHDSYDRVLKFLNTYLSSIFIGIFALYFTFLILAMVELQSHEYMFVMFIKLFLHLVLFISIFLTARKLMSHLKEHIIFDHDNALYIHQIGSTFIYMALIEIIIGFILGVLTFISNPGYREFSLQMNDTLILFIFFGLILLLVSYILKKAIEIYEENQLTI